MHETDNVLDNPPGAPRRGKRLPPIQTTFAPDPIRTVQRPPPVETIIYKTSPERPMPSREPPATNRRASRNFLGLFSRSRSVKDLQFQKVSNAIAEAEEPRRSSQTLDPKAMDCKPKKSVSTRKDRPHRSIMTWDPLPLFQAYSQGVKCSTLPAPTVSADAIIKIDKQLQTRKKSDFATLDNISAGASLPFNDAAQDESKRSRRSSPGTGTFSWTTKTYVLTGSGFLLQYAGSGHHDRLPENIMQLTSDSAAFASDAIPGKHWVLQVTSSFPEEGAGSVPPSKSMFSKLRSETQRNANSFLLVMESAEEMNSWLISVRKEIQALGGQSYRPDEIARKDPSEVVQQLRQKPSRRFLIQRTPEASADQVELSRGVNLQDGRESADESNGSTISTDGPFLSHTGTTRSEMSRCTIRHKSSLHNSNERFGTPRTALSHVSQEVPPNVLVPDHPDSGALLKWELPTNFTPTFSGIGSGFAASNDFDPRRESMSSVPSLSSQGRSHRSLSEQSDTQAPNFSVPIFSNRFSRSTRSGSLTTPPTSSGSTYRATSPASRLQDTPPKPTRSIAGDLPTILTDPSWEQHNDATEVDKILAEDEGEWDDVDDLQPIPAPVFKPALPKRYSSLGNNYALFPPQSMGEAATKQHSLSPPELQSPRRHSAVEFSAVEFSASALPRSPDRLSYLPPPHPPPTGALPAIPSDVPAKPGTSSTTPNLRRPASMQIRPTLRPDAADSMLIQPASHLAIHWSVRERRSFIGRSPSHVLGPPMAPPPTNPLPEIPRTRVAEENTRLWTSSSSKVEPIHT
ncbi:MAG: hypothetical protein LQ340_000615 [Diploschistes diacapsis]|nr:MAG: hypothetical protein LQ340_000615 [Diploschistes diacapsis]